MAARARHRLNKGAGREGDAFTACDCSTERAGGHSACRRLIGPAWETVSNHLSPAYYVTVTIRPGVSGFVNTELEALDVARG